VESYLDYFDGEPCEFIAANANGVYFVPNARWMLRDFERCRVHGQIESHNRAIWGYLYGKPQIALIPP
jgi:hypothetical protein